MSWKIGGGEVDSLNKQEWKEFIFEDIFNICATHSGIDKNKLLISNGEVPYITRTDKNNAIDYFIGEQKKQYKTDIENTITIWLDTQTIFYQSYKFYTGQNIQILTSHQLNKFNAFFLIPLIKKQMQKFSWGGNGATLTRLRRSKILLPYNSKGHPDYAYMENYMKQLEYQKLSTYIEYKK